jgi:phosphopantothenoylcysteine decarboxylase/phosphopantothenate--cysteine ligase
MTWPQSWYTVGMMKGRRILLGISGGIAAYKAAELVRLFVKEGAEVRVVMTRAAQKFITPLTLQALSKNPVGIDTFDLTQEATISHIDLADRAELLVVAPASADVIAKLAHGFADEMLTTCALASKAPLLLAPAMNVNMWKHPATQKNMQALISRGAHVVGPDSGDLACGWVGAGRMAEPSEILAAAGRVFARRDLEGKRLLITAGPTEEPLDPVRFLGNRSSGKMGFALAEAALMRGAAVTLIAGPVELTTPAGAERIDVHTALEMERQVSHHVDRMHAVLMVAAVADYRPQKEAIEKLKREKLGASTSVALTANPDILAGLGRRSYPNGRPLLVGFAAETGNLESRAQAKLKRKGCDMLIANDVSKGKVFGEDGSRIVILDKGSKRTHLEGSKRELAHEILDRLAARLGKSAKEKRA